MTRWLARAHCLITVMIAPLLIAAPASLRAAPDTWDNPRPPKAAPEHTTERNNNRRSDNTLPDEDVSADYIPFSAALSADGRDIIIEGDIELDGLKPLRALLDATPNPVRVVINSPGGQLIAAQGMASAIRTRGLDTHVDVLCASACTIIFLAGANRTIGPNALIGFHQARLKGDDTPDPLLNRKSLDQLMRILYRKADVSEAFIDRIIQTPAAEMMVLGAAELLQEKIITALPKPAKAR